MQSALHAVSKHTGFTEPNELHIIRHSEISKGTRRLTLHIRPANLPDVEGLEFIEQTAWDVLSTPMPVQNRPAFGELLQLEDTLVAEFDVRIVGYVTIGPRSSAQSNSHVGKVRSIAVVRELRGQEIGVALLKAALDWCKKRGWKKVMVMVLSSNIPAIALYRSAGFVEEARLRNEFQIENAFVDDIYMTLWLEPL